MDLCLHFLSYLAFLAFDDILLFSAKIEEHGATPIQIYFHSLFSPLPFPLSILSLFLVFIVYLNVSGTDKIV